LVAQTADHDREIAEWAIRMAEVTGRSGYRALERVGTGLSRYPRLSRAASRIARVLGGR
jgi:hypothetical protein